VFRPPTRRLAALKMPAVADFLLAGPPPAAVYGYLLARLRIPVLPIVLAAPGASPIHKIGLVDYLTLTGGSSGPSSTTTAVDPGKRGITRDSAGIIPGNTTPRCACDRRPFRRSLAQIAGLRTPQEARVHCG
jgi:hypothetical protein